MLKRVTWRRVYFGIRLSIEHTPIYVLYNDVNATRAVIGRCPWSTRVQIHGWRAVLKMFVRFFWIKQVKASKKVWQELFSKNKNGDKKSSDLDNLRMSKLHATKLHNGCHRVTISLRESRCFAKCFRHYSAVSKWRRWKTFRNCLQVG